MLVHLDEGDLVTAVARVVPDDDKGEEEVEAGVAGDSGGTEGDGPEQGDLLGGAE